MNKVNLFEESRGIAALEASLTLPVLVILIFFILEMMKINNVQTAVDSIATEATFDFIVNKNTNNFEKIRDKYLPKYINASNSKWYFAIYKDLETMCATSPYGGEDIYWPTNTEAPSNPTEYIVTTEDTSFLCRTGNMDISNCEKPEESFGSTNQDNEEFKTLCGKAFVLTFVCDYQFSSSLISKIFSGGSNTKGKTKFLIWGRGVGICN